MARLALEYFLTVFLAALGVLQVVAWRSRLLGLLFFHSRLLTGLFSALTIASALAWFLWGAGSRLAPGLEGAQQLDTFSRAALGAVAFTLMLASFLHRRRFEGRRDGGPGLEALKRMTYLQALGQALEEGRRKDRDVSTG